MYFSPYARPARDPFANVRRVQQEINRMFGELGAGDDSQTLPPVNIWAGEESLVVTAEVPGIAAGDLDINVRAQTLTIQGKRDPHPEGQQVSWHRRERSAGAFGRVIELPFPVDPDKVEARLADGILELKLQRPETEKPKKIQIKSS